MKANEPELKPCPFCGAMGRKVRTRLRWRSWDVVCLDCGCSVGCFDRESEAVAAWNRRAEKEGGNGMSENRLETILEGTTSKAALAYLNTLRRIHSDIAPKVMDVDFHLGRIADEYSTSDVADGIAIARNVNALLRIMDNIHENIEALEKEVNNLKEKENENEETK